MTEAPFNPASLELKNKTTHKFKETIKLSKNYNNEVEIAFFLELDAFLENFREAYHLA